jgi:nitrogen fixation/metabolism regulation signal transduction histidine kinase
VHLAIERDRVRHALINLIDNAHDAMTQRSTSGDPVVHVSTRVVDGCVEVEIRDSGSGIPPELMEQIHEPLFSTTSFGVGLGLPVVRPIMEDHGASWPSRTACRCC